MDYKVREGVVSIRICDTDILTAKREIWDSCPVVRPLPRHWAFAFFLVERRGSSELALEGLSKVFGKTMEETRRLYEPVFEKLHEDGFLVPVEEKL